MERKTGIYKITNNLNQNSYIGQSIDIYKRWQTHKQRYKYQDKKEYNKVLYKAFRKYGIENFSFIILEECLKEELNKKEKYWIAYYDTYYHGYNETSGGDNNYHQQEGEKHHNHKLTEADVIEIRLRWAECNISTRELYYDYQQKISKTGFKKIYNWETWKKILPELNTPERREWHRNNLVSYSCFGNTNPKSLINDKEFEQIIKRYNNGETLDYIYEDYKDRYLNIQSFKAAMQGRFKKRNII